MARLRSAIYFILVAFAAPYIYDRYIALSSMLSNRPGKLQPEYKFKSHEIKFKDTIRNCEDIILEESLGIAFLSCDPGRDRWNTVMGTFHLPSHKPSISNYGKIWIYDYSTQDLPNDQALRPLILRNYSSPMDFHPLGLDYDPTTSTLYVINHTRKQGSIIEAFLISITAGTATFAKRLHHPLIQAPNSLHLLGDGKMYVTNDHYLRAKVSRLGAQIETFAGIPGGTVVYTDMHDPSATKLVARVPFANGIAQLNSTTLAVASSSKPGVYLYTINHDRSLVFEKFIRTPAGADNLSIDAHGKLLIAGHPFAPSLMAVAKGRAICDEEGNAEEKRACGCWAPSWVGEWSEEGGLRTLLRDSGEGENAVCSSSTAVRDVRRGVGMVSMLYGKGVVVLRE